MTLSHAEFILVFLYIHGLKITIHLCTNVVVKLLYTKIVISSSLCDVPHLLATHLPIEIAGIYG